MNHYFIEKNNERKGPFTIEEMKDMRLTDEYIIWSESFNEWKHISSIKDLEEYIIKTPPLNTKKKLSVSSPLQISLFSLLVFTVIFVVGYLNEVNSSYKITEQWGNFMGRNDSLITYMFINSVFKSSLISLLIFISFYWYYKKSDISTAKLAFKITTIAIVISLILYLLYFYLSDYHYGMSDNFIIDIIQNKIVYLFCYTYFVYIISYYLSLKYEQKALSFNIKKIFSKKERKENTANTETENNNDLEDISVEENEETGKYEDLIYVFWLVVIIAVCQYLFFAIPKFQNLGITEIPVYIGGAIPNLIIILITWLIIHRIQRKK